MQDLPNHQYHGGSRQAIKGNGLSPCYKGIMLGLYLAILEQWKGNIGTMERKMEITIPGLIRDSQDSPRAARSASC